MVCTVAAIGVLLIRAGDAATYSVPAETEGGLITGAAGVAPQSAASGAAAVRFGASPLQAARAEAKVSFTFDDGFNDTVSQAAPALARHGVPGTAYIITNCVGMTTAPNNCRANRSENYLTWTQVKQLRDQFGWEIASHSASHPLMASSDPPEQYTIPTQAQIRQEMEASKSAFGAQGINVTAFASPYGDYSDTSQAEIARQYTSHRGFWDLGNNVWPYNDYLLRNMQVQGGVSTTSVKTAIDQAIAGKHWLVLTFHGIKPNASTNPDAYQYATARLEEIAAYAAQKRAAGVLKTITVSQGLVEGGTNLLPGGSFAGGLGSGWRTDNAGRIVANDTGNGRTPDAAHSIRFNSATGTARLYAPSVSVNSATTYVFKQFLKLSGGQVSFYIDEYGADGTRISGQSARTVTGPVVEEVNFAYKPSSAAVAKAGLQVVVMSGASGYYDAAELLAP